MKEDRQAVDGKDSHTNRPETKKHRVVVVGGTSTLNEAVSQVLIEKGQGAFYFDEIHYKTVGGKWKKPTQQNKPWYRQGSRW